MSFPFARKNRHLHSAPSSPRGRSIFCSGRIAARRADNNFADPPRPPRHRHRARILLKIRGVELSCVTANNKLPRPPAEFKRRRTTLRTQLRRRAHRRDRLGIRPAVGGAGRVGDMGRHGRHAYVKAPETTSPAGKRERAKARDSLKSRRATNNHRHWQCIPPSYILTNTGSAVHIVVK